METLFQNEYTRDKEWAKDVYGYLYFRRPIMRVFAVFFALYFIIGVYDMTVNGMADLYLILVALIWFSFVIFQYKRNVNMIIKRDQELHGKPIEVCVTVTDDVIEQSQSTGSVYRLNYCDIKKVVQTKKFLYLWSKTKMLYSFKTDSFSVGDSGDFLSFLKNKGIKTKLNK